MPAKLEWPGRGRPVLYNPKSKRWEHVDAVPEAGPLIDKAQFGTEKGRPFGPSSNLLIEGENIFALKALLPHHAGKVDLVYIDPPFNTGGDFKAYRDSFDHPVWLSMMEERLRLCRELLAETGSLYLHLDPNEAHYAKVLLDEIFGRERFQREIVWRMGWVSGFKTGARNYIRNHDTILFYTKSGKFTFNKSFIPHPKGYRRRDGSAPKGRGVPLEDTWNCQEADKLDSIQIMSFSKEKTGFETQKNENLLERVITTSSNPGDLVLDCFGGSGSTAAAAHKCGRRWIHIERGPSAVKKALARMKKVLAGKDPYGITRSQKWRGGGGFRRMEAGPATTRDLWADPA